MANTSKVLDMNKKLAIAAAVLLLLSGWTHWRETARADRFASGQKLLQNLNPDDIAKITVARGDETVTLEREDDRFVVVEQHRYHARNDVVNRTIRGLLDIELARLVGEGEGVEVDTGLSGEGAEPTQVALLNAAGEAMVQIAVGVDADTGAGTFVKRQAGKDAAVYLTTESLAMTTEAAEFLEKEIVNVATSAVRRIEGADFVIAREDESGELKLVEPAAAGKTSEISKLSSFLDRLRFEEVVVADDPRVTGLAFEQALRYELADESGYRIFVARDGDETFVKIGGSFGVERIELAQDSTDDELKEKSEILKRSDEINRFNDYSSQWVYKLESFNAEKLALRAADLRE